VVRFGLLVPPSNEEHQRRRRARQRGLGHVPEPSWSQVMARAEEFESWRNEPTARSADGPVEELARRFDPDMGGLASRPSRSKSPRGWRWPTGAGIRSRPARVRSGSVAPDLAARDRVHGRGSRPTRRPCLRAERLTCPGAHSAVGRRPDTDPEADQRGRAGAVGLRRPALL